MEQSLIDWATFRADELPTHIFTSYYQFNRPQPIYIATITNGAWVDAAENFITTQVRPVTRHNFPNSQGDRNIWPAINSQMSTSARNMVQSGFANDEIRHVMPFNTQFWNRLTSRPDYYFWVFQEGDGMFGLYGWGRVGTAIGTGNRANDRRHARTLAHEIGHHLGLNEHLTHFFDEAMTGIERGQHSALYRTSIMDWIMMEQAGQVEFMQAIFWGNDTYYRQIWDDYIYPVMGITYENMQLARAASEFAFGSYSAADQSVRQSLLQVFGHTDQQGNGRFYLIGDSFEGAFDTSLTQAMRNQHINFARQSVNNMADWARGRNLQPYNPFLSHAEGIPTREILVPID